MTPKVYQKTRSQRGATSAISIVDRRFSAREGHLRDEHSWKSAGRQRRTLTLNPATAREFPALAVHLASHGSELPDIRRDSTARVKRIEAMFRRHGDVVLLTVTTTLRVLDHLTLHSATLARRATGLSMTGLKRLTISDCPHETAVQRGGRWEGTHVHFCIPVRFLLPDLQALVLSAPRGPGKGCELRPGLHGVILSDTPTDRKKVARYMGRHPDGRFDFRGHHPDRLTAFEELLLRRTKKHGPEPLLVWFQR